MPRWSGKLEIYYYDQKLMQYFMESVPMPTKDSDQFRATQQIMLSYPFVADAPDSFTPIAVNAVMATSLKPGYLEAGDASFVSTVLCRGRRVYLFTSNEAWNIFCGAFAMHGARKLYTLESALVAP